MVVLGSNWSYSNLMLTNIMHTDTRTTKTSNQPPLINSMSFFFGTPCWDSEWVLGALCICWGKQHYFSTISEPFRKATEDCTAYTLEKESNRTELAEVLRPLVHLLERVESSLLKSIWGMETMCSGSVSSLHLVLKKEDRRVVIFWSNKLWLDLHGRAIPGVEWRRFSGFLVIFKPFFFWHLDSWGSKGKLHRQSQSSGSLLHKWRRDGCQYVALGLLSQQPVGEQGQTLWSSSLFV